MTAINIPMEHVLVLAGVLFALGLTGVLVRRNVIFLLMSLEIMMNATGLAFVAAGARWAAVDGQVMYVLVLSLQPAEVARRSRTRAAARTPLRPPRHRRGERTERMTMALALADPGAAAPRLLVAARHRRQAARSVPVAIIGAGSVGARGARHADGDARLPRRRSRAPISCRRCGRGCRSATSRRASRCSSTGSRVVMLGVITGVGFLIHLYATGYMARRDGLQPLLRVHEPVRVRDVDARARRRPARRCTSGGKVSGLCSYLLIGFFHDDPENGYAARKAFVVTRVGDVAFALGLFLLYREFGTLEIAASARRTRRRMAGRLGDVHARSRCCCSAAPSANPRSCRCRPGCPTRWRVRRRCPR